MNDVTLGYNTLIGINYTVRIIDIKIVLRGPTLACIKVLSVVFVKKIRIRKAEMHAIVAPDYKCSRIVKMARRCQFFLNNKIIKIRIESWLK